MQKKFKLLIIILIIIIVLLALWELLAKGTDYSVLHFGRQITNLVIGNERACIFSGGQVATVDCYCYGAHNFYNNCLIGACSCPPREANKRELKTCMCPENKCWDGTTCVTLFSIFNF